MFLLSFHLALRSNSHNCYIYLKDNQNVIQQLNSVIQITLMRKILNVLFEMVLSRAINKFSLISKLKLLGSLDKIVKSLKLMLQSQTSQ